MYTDNSDSNSNNLYWSTDGEHYHPISKEDYELSKTISSIYCEITEEDAAKLWAMIEGLEIVLRG